MSAANASERSCAIASLPRATGPVQRSSSPARPVSESRDSSSRSKPPPACWASACATVVAPDAVTTAFAAPLEIVRQARALRLIDAPVAVLDATQATPAEIERSILDAIETTTSRSTLVTVVDDAHRLDDASLLVLERLAKRVVGLRLVLVVTARAEERAAQPRLAASLARIEGATAGFAIRLAALVAADLEPAVLEAVRGVKPLIARERDAILARAAGSPYFVEELLRAYVAGISPETPSPTLEAAIVERFRSLDPVAQSVLRIAAAIGQSFDIALLGRIAAIDETTLFAARRAARDAAVIVEPTTARRSFTRSPAKRSKARSIRTTGARRIANSPPFASMPTSSSVHATRSRAALTMQRRSPNARATPHGAFRPSRCTHVLRRCARAHAERRKRGAVVRKNRRRARAVGRIGARAKPSRRRLRRTSVPSDTKKRSTM